MDIRTRDTFNSRIADTLQWRAPRQYDQQQSSYLLQLRTVTRSRKGDLNIESWSHKVEPWFLDCIRIGGIKAQFSGFNNPLLLYVSANSLTARIP